MRNSCDVTDGIREKLAELRRAARTLKPVESGSAAERKIAAVKGYKSWADTRERAELAVPHFERSLTRQA
jgi:isopentenyl phosphate kinase